MASFEKDVDVLCMKITSGNSGKNPVQIPDSNPACTEIFPGSSHTSDLKFGTPVATLPGAWRYRVSAMTGRPGVSIL